MVTKIHRDALQSEVSSLRSMLQDAPAKDPLGSLSLRKRLANLEAELRGIEENHQMIANVALVFDGDPVRGSSAIDALFAGRALQEYQDLIAKQVAVSGGHLAERGRIPEGVHAQARMNVTSLVHGSFGFVLEEDAADQLAMFDTPARQAVGAVTNLLSEVSAADGRRFEDKLGELDIRVFQTLKRFIGTLHKARSTLKLSEFDRELRLSNLELDRAYERVSQVDVDEIDETFEGELLGLVPIQRRFEFRRSDNGEYIQGRVDVNLSADYLERIEQEGLFTGAGWRAVIRTKTIQHPDGRHTKVTHTLVDLTRV